MSEKQEISYEKTQNSLENKEYFVFLREDILNPYFDFKFKQKLLKNSKLKTIFYDDKVKKVEEQIDTIFSVLKQKGLEKKDLDKIEIKSEGKVYIEYQKDGIKDKLIFNLENKENIFLGDTERIKQDKENLNKKSVKNLEKSDRILQAMDYIFKQNDKEIFDVLEDEDILKTDKFGSELNGKNLKDLQKLFKESFEQINKQDIEKLNKDIREDYIKQSKKYLEMFMGVGDIYEGGVKELKETTDNFSFILKNIMKFSSTRNILNYLKELHKKIDDNNYQSTSVEKSYDLLMKTSFHKEILNKLIKENASDKEFVLFAKIITGRGRHGLSSDIDDNLRDPETANEALLYMMNKKNGVIDKLKKSGNIKIENKEIENKNPKFTVDNLRLKFYEKYGNKIKGLKYFDQIMNNAGYSDVLSIGEGKNYKDLDYIQQVKLGVLNKVLDKFDKLENRRKGGRHNHTPGTDLENTNLKDFGNLFNDVAKDYNKKITEDLKQSFDSENPFSGEGFWFGKDAKEQGLDGVQAEAYDLFQDIIGNGVFDLSDTSIEYLKTGAKFAGVIAIAMTVPLIVLPVLGVAGMGAAMGATASLASMAINPKGYDTVDEAVVDISSDIALGTVTGAIGGAWASKYEGLGIKAFSKQFYKNSKVIMGSDLMFLGLVPEAGRMILVDKEYHNYNILEDNIDK